MGISCVSPVFNYIVQSKSLVVLILLFISIFSSCHSYLSFIMMDNIIPENAAWTESQWDEHVCEKLANKYVHSIMICTDSR